MLDLPERHLFLGSGGTRGERAVAILIHERWESEFNQGEHSSVNGSEKFRGKNLEVKILFPKSMGNTKMEFSSELLPEQ